MRKRILSWVLALAMCLTLLPASALAEETAGAPQEPTTEDAPPAAETVTSETFTVDTSGADLPDNDELFAAYVQQLMYPSYGVTPLADWGMTSDVLNKDEQSVYEILKSYIGRIADGDRAETNNFTLYMTSPSWTYEDLEVEGSDDPSLQAKVQEAFSKVFDISKVVNCLLVDCPESFYWYDKTYNDGTTSAASYTYTYSCYNDRVSIASLTFSFVVAEDYRSEGSLYTVDSAKISAAQTPLKNASIVASTPSNTATPYERLKFYKEKICELTSYNDEAASEGNDTPYGDPWQLIYVFDGDPNTNVVCEGYAKAFQYLCDCSNLPCYTVTGTMTGGIGAGAHMWNIVTLNGNNYLVDVTNCDEWTVGAPDLLFLKAPNAGGSPERGYTFTVDDRPVTYTYDDDTRALYGDDILTLAGEDYVAPAPQVYIIALNVELTPPAAGEAPATSATINEVTTTVGGERPSPTVNSVTWEPAVKDTFVPGTAYTATLTLTAPDGYWFSDSLNIGVAEATESSDVSEDGKTLTITATFPETPDPADLTRVELAEMLHNKFTLGYKHTSYPNFDDISDCTREQLRAIWALVDLGYLTGSGSDPSHFDPDGAVPAWTAATLIARLIAGDPNVAPQDAIESLEELGILDSGEVTVDLNDTAAMQDGTLEGWLNRFVTRAELAEQLNSETYSWLHNSIHLMTPSLSVQFDDLNVCTADQETAIETLAANQILSGTSQDTFNPTGVVTRAQAAVVLWRAAGSRSNVNPVSLLATYTDLVKTPWYQPAFNCLYAMGVLTGDDATGNVFGLDTVVSDGTLTSWLEKCNTALGKTDLNTITRVGGITRAEMAEKVYNDYKTLLADKLFGITELRGPAAFTDISGCTEAQKEAIDFFYRRGFIDGTDESTFTPYAAASNAQIAVFLHRCATAANSGSGTDTVTETAGDGTLQASLLHDSGEWYADAVNFLIQQGGGSLTINGTAITRVENFTNPDAPGIGDEMTAWNNGLKPTQPTISCTNGTVTITRQTGETVYYTTGDGDPIADGQVYDTTFTVSAVTTVKAVAVRNNMVSAVVSETCLPAPSELTVELSRTSFTYNGSSQTPTVTVKLGDTELTESTDYNVSYTNSNGGAGNTINAGTVTVTVTGTDTGSYAGKTGTATYTIAPAELTIKAKDQTITYGGSIVQDVAQCMVSGLCSPDTLTNITLTASATDVTTTGTITPSDAYIKNGDMDVTANYDITYVNGKLIILKATPTIIFQEEYASGKTYDGAPLADPAEQDLTITGGSYNDVKFTWYQGAVGSGTPLASAPKDAGTYYVVASIAETANTTAATATSGSITISKRAITVIPDSNQSKVYGTADPLLTYTVGGDGLVDGETLTGALFRVPGEKVGSYAINQGSLSASGNYDLTVTDSVFFTITRAPRTISAPTKMSVSSSTVTLNSVTPSDGEDNGTVQYGYATIDSSDDINNWQTETTFTGLEPTTTYYFFARVTGGTNYEDATSTGTLITTTDKDPHNMTDFAQSSLELTYGDTSAGQTVTCSTGSTIMYSSSDPATVSVDPTTGALTIRKVTGEIPVTITATAAAAGEYAEATRSYTVTVAPKTLQIIGLTAIDRPYAPDNLTVTLNSTNARLDGVEEGDAVQVEAMPTTGTMTNADAGTDKQVTVEPPKLIGDHSGNYILAEITGVTVNISKADATEAMKAASGTITAGKAGSLSLNLPTGATASVNSAPSEVKGATISGDTLTYTGGAGVVSDTAYTVTINVANATNYRDYTITVTLTGTDKLTPELSVEPVTKTYDGQPVDNGDIHGTATYGGNSVPGSWIWATDQTMPTDVSTGTYTVVFTPADSGTYATATATVTVTINPAPLTLALSASHSTLPASGGTVTLTLTGMPGDSTQTPVVVCTSHPSVDVMPGGTSNTWTVTLPGGGGTYSFTATVPAAGNYASGTGTCTVTVSQQPTDPPVTPPVDPNYPTGGSETAGDYTVTVDRTTGGKVTVNPGRADKGDTVTITAIPNDGYVVDEVTVNGVTNGVKYLGNNKYSFTMPGSSAKISVTFVKEGAQTDLPFADVSESFWARNEIQWAYENGYVNGSTATAFNPNGTISRQQVWMILARIAGEDPANMAEAKAWAIANGVSDGSNPGGSVTRQQLVTILYRFAGQNGYDTTARADLSGYPDVTTVASYATEAMAWAVAEGIIGGTTQGTLNPAGTASRAQFAVILYRYMA